MKIKSQDCLKPLPPSLPLCALPPSQAQFSKLEQKEQYSNRLSTAICRVPSLRRRHSYNTSQLLHVLQ